MNEPVKILTDFTAINRTLHLTFNDIVAGGVLDVSQYYANIRRRRGGGVFTVKVGEFTTIGQGVFRHFTPHSRDETFEIVLDNGRHLTMGTKFASIRRGVNNGTLVIVTRDELEARIRDTSKDNVTLRT